MADTLRDWITALPPGTRLPTQAEIAGHFDVSPGCRDAAINVLKQENLIHTARGVGMLVAMHPEQASQQSLASLARQVADSAAELARRLADIEGEVLS